MFSERKSLLFQQTVRRLRSASIKERFALGFSLFVFALAYLLNISLPLIFAKLIDSLDRLSFTEILLLIVVAYPVIFVLARLVSEIAELIYMKFEGSFEVGLVKEIMPRIFNAKLEVLERRAPSRISFEFYHGTEGYTGLLLIYLYVLFPRMIEIAAATAIISVETNLLIAACFFVTTVTFVIFVARTAPRIAESQRRIFNLKSEIGSFVDDAFNRIVTVKSYGQQSQETARLLEIVKEKRKEIFRCTTIKVIVFAAQNGILLLGMALIMYLTARDYDRGAATIGDFVMLNGYIVLLFSPLSVLGFTLMDVKQKAIEAGKLFDLAALPPPPPRDTAAGPGVALTEIAYPKPAASVLKQVSLTLEPGSRTLITGPSGAGKTTLLKIMAGLYSDYDGRIALSPANGVRGEGQGVEAVYLSQSDGLFDRPFLENLCYPLEGLDPPEIAAILTFAGLTEYLDAARYPDVKLLSAGERQRVKLGRLYREERGLLLLDEPTSALDSALEQQVLGNLFRLKPQTIVLVSHRIQSVAEIVDRVIVMEGGAIVGSGSHAALLRGNALYRRLHDAAG